jgi:histidinol-phosphatase (PHP family)
MIDYHLHLWPHTQRDKNLTLDFIASYWEKACELGISEIAITEHLFRFKQADWLLSKWWECEEDSLLLRHSMENYWYMHIGADLDVYVDTIIEAKKAGIAVKLGLEVDFYRGKMDKVAKLLSDYPFDVLLGSVHWISTWRFDDLSDQISMDEWSLRDAKTAWSRYLGSLEELLETKVVDVIAHPDLIKVAGFFPDEGFKREFESSLVEIIIKSELVTELSSAGWRKPVNEQYPSIFVLSELTKRNAKFTLASDAHNINDVGSKVNKLRDILHSLGLSKIAAFTQRTVKEINLYDS